MKTILLLAVVIVLTCATPWTTFKKDDKIGFKFDAYENSPISLAMEGVVDPQNDKMNEIQAFLRLAGQYIPILEALSSQDNSLQYQIRNRITIANIIDIEYYFYLQLIVGWEVSPGGSTVDSYNVTYTPFAWGSTAVGTNGTTWPAEAGAEASMEFIYAYAPISLSLYQSGKVCFSSRYVINPVQFGVRLDASLRECEDEILDDVINGNPIFEWNCNMIDEVNVNFIDIDLFDGVRGTLTGLQCIQF